MFIIIIIYYVMYSGLQPSRLDLRKLDDQNKNKNKIVTLLLLGETQWLTDYLVTEGHWQKKNEIFYSYNTSRVKYFTFHLVSRLLKYFQMKVQAARMGCYCRLPLLLSSRLTNVRVTSNIGSQNINNWGTTPTPTPTSQHWHCILTIFLQILTVPKKR